MSNAAELLTELQDSGVQLRLADGELELSPFSKVTGDQVVLLEENGQVLEQLVELQEWQKALEEDGELYRNIRDQIRERTKDGEYGVSYQIHTTSYEENYVYCVAHSKAVQGQKNFEKVLDNP